MSSFAHEYPIRILNHGHNSPMMTDRREFPNCVSTILQSLWFFWNTCFPRYYRVHVVVISFFRCPPFSKISKCSFKLHFFHLNIFILCQILSRLSSKQMHFSLVSQERKGFTNIWIKKTHSLVWRISKSGCRIWSFELLFVWLFVFQVLIILQDEKWSNHDSNTWTQIKAVTLMVICLLKLRFAILIFSTPLKYTRATSFSNVLVIEAQSAFSRF